MANFAVAGANSTGYSMLDLRIKFQASPDYAFTQYSQTVNVDRENGDYWIEEWLDAHRPSPAAAWRDGEPRPRTGAVTDRTRKGLFRTVRLTEHDHVGDQRAAANPNAIRSVQDALAAKMMLRRAIATASLLTTAGNYASRAPGNVVTATALTGGTLDGATVADPKIMTMIHAGYEKLRQATLGAVRFDHLVLIVGPDVAMAMRRSGEFMDMIKSSPDAKANFTTGQGLGDAYLGLPGRPYGVQLVVDERLIVTSGPHATVTTTGTVWPAKTAVLTVRPREIVPVGSPGFGAVAHFVHKDFEEYVGVDSVNNVDQRTLVSITENRDSQLIAPEAALLVTGCLP